jgi:protein SCO1/2
MSIRKNLSYGLLAALAVLSISPTALADAPPSATSIYNLRAKLVDQNGHPQQLDAYRGQPVLVSMFYSSCPNTCPLLIDTIKSVEAALAPADRALLRVLLISVDPERDTPQVLRELAASRHLDSARWTLATTDAATVRKVAAVLNVQYRRLPNGEFNHSSIITILSPQGEILKQSSTLGAADAAVMAALGSAMKLARPTTAK